MPAYQNLGGDSGVVSYEISPNYIVVWFKEGQNKKYTYDYQSTGMQDVEEMKRLAQSGIGLNSYIGKHVRDRYASKEAA
jgi:hypothetical protein